MENNLFANDLQTKKSKLHTWLVSLAIGGVALLMGIGGYFTNNYKKVSAYDFDGDSITFTFTDGVITDDNGFFKDYLISITDSHLDNDGEFDDNFSTLGFNFYFLNNDNDIKYVSSTLYRSSTSLSLNFESTDNENESYFYLSYDLNEEPYVFETDGDSPLSLTCFSSYGECYSSLTSYFGLGNSSLTTEDWQGILTELISLLTGGIIGLSSGIGQGASTLVTDIFISNNALSVMGGMIVVFAGISLAIGLCRWVMNFLTSLGAKK